MLCGTNVSPLVGILCIDVASQISDVYGSEVTSYIDASYVKFVEFSGCRPVPIWIGKSDEYYKDIMKKINGIIMPGGAVYIDSSQMTRPGQTNVCVASVGQIYEIACEMNRNGTHFPLLGICLGYELLLYHAFKDECDDELRENCKFMNVSKETEFTNEFSSSKMFGDLTEDMRHIFETEPFAFHYHSYCITVNKLKQFKGYGQWSVTSVSRDEDDLEFIASCEHKTYPFYGVQFHPEKVLFDFTRDHIKRNQNIVKCSQYLGNFFASECHKCPNVVPSKQDAQLLSIYNFPIEYTAMKGLRFEQCYLFKKNADYPVD